MVALYVGGVALLGACSPTDDAPSNVRSVVQRVDSADEVGGASITSPESSVSSSQPFHLQRNAAVAAGNGLSLVVWSELVGPMDEDVYAVRVRASDGAVLDATPLRIATGSAIQHQPAVAFDGTNFLVVWDELRQSTPQVYGTRVRASDGAVLDVPRHLSRNSYQGPPQFSPSVAFDGTNFVVTWEGYIVTDYGGSYNIQGIRVRPSDGQPIESVGFVVSRVENGGWSGLRSEVACGGGRCLVVWSSLWLSNGVNHGFELQGVRLEASTSRRLDSSPLRFTNTPGVKELYPSVASDGKDFLVTWQTGYGWTTTVGALSAARVRGSDGVPLEPSLTLAADHFSKANLTFDGSDYRVVYQRPWEGARQLVVTRVSPEGVVASGAEHVISTHQADSSQQVGIGATSKGRFLVAYGKYDGALGMERLRFREVVDLPNGEACSDGVPCQSGLCVDGVCCESACGGGAPNDCQTCSVAAGGSVNGVCGAVRADMGVVCRPASVACDVAETCDGTGVVCPADEASASEPDLSGDKCEDLPCDVANYLAALGPEALEPSIRQALLTKAEAACRAFQAGNTHAMQGQLWALSSQVRAQYGNGIPPALGDALLAALSGMFRPGMCVPVESPVLVEPEPLPTASTEQSLLPSPETLLPLSKPSGNQKGVVSASAGDVTLVVWSETDARGYQDIRAMRVRKSDGAWLDSTPLCIACGDTFTETDPSVASNGQDFLVTWSETDSRGSYSYSPSIRGRQVRGSDGAVLFPIMTIGYGYLGQRFSSVASDGKDYLVAWQGSQYRCVAVPWGSWLSCGYYYVITGARVSATGVTGSSFELSSNTVPSYGQGPVVAFAGGNYLVTWTGNTYAYGSERIYSTRVRASDSVVLDNPALLVASSGRNSSVTSDGSQFLVGWSTPAGEVRASRMGLEGTVLDSGGFLVGLGTWSNVLFDGTDFRVVRKQGQELRGVRVTREGLVVGDSEVVLTPSVSPTMVADGRPALANLGPGRFLVGYTQVVDTQSFATRGALRVVDDLPLGLACTQDAQCRSGSCVDGVCCESACGGGVGNDCQACSVATGGSADGTCSPVRADAAVVCRPSAVACDAAEVCDGGGFSCPADEPGASQPDLTCDKCQDTPCDVANYLAALGPELLLQSTGHSLQLKADAACRSFQAGKTAATEGHLKALLNEVRSQQGKTLSATVADTLIASLTDLLSN